MKKADILLYRKKSERYYKKAHIILTKEEKENIEIADFGLNNFEKVGLEIVTYINTDKVCAKEMVLLPYQTCPEHRHVPTDGKEGKEETFRCRYGDCWLYTDSQDNDNKDNIHVPMPETDVTVFHETHLLPGEQFTIYPGTLHWFCAGKNGAVISEFSTHSTDETDYFTDKRIVRLPTEE